MNKLHFSLKEMASITKGYWENISSSQIEINGFNNTLDTLKKGDAFVIINDNFTSANTDINYEEKVKEAISKEISAIVIDNRFEIKTNIPILRVDNTYLAMMKLSQYVFDETSSKKVFLLGSRGKKEFKTHLNHLLAKKNKMHINLHCINDTASYYCNCASLNKENDIFIMDMPNIDEIKKDTSVYNNTTNIVVLTTIEENHIEKIIKSKILLKENCKFLLNKEDIYFEKIEKELKKYKNIDIKTFGNSSSNNANILFKRLRNYGWDIVAKIENKVVSYRVPAFEEYIPVNSLAVVLCAYYLDVDIHEAVEEYYNIENNNFHIVRYKNKKFFLYLKNIEAIKNIFNDKKIREKYYNDFKDLEKNNLENIEKNDIVYIKGILKKDLPEFIEYLKNTKEIQLSSIGTSEIMLDKNQSLKDLRTIEPNDINIFKKYVNSEDKKGWIYYFPFIYFWSLSGLRVFLLQKKDNYINLFMLDKFNRTDTPKLNLYIPTLPLNSDGLKNAFEIIYQYNGYKKAHITQLDQDDVSSLKAIESNLKVKFKNIEYMHSPMKYNNLSGKKFRNLRHELLRMDRNENTELVAYEKKYEDECLELYEYWYKEQGEKYKHVGDKNYTRSCILNYDVFNRKDLNGYIVLQNKKVMSFGFVGYMSDNMLNFFIGKSNHSLKGVQTYLRYELMMMNQDYNLVNDGPGISKGLHNSKRTFCPVKKHKLYIGTVEK